MSEPSKRVRVAVVDDEPLLVHVIVRVLDDGYDVEGVADPQLLLDRLAEGAAYDVVLCDLLMPRMSGVTLYERTVASHPEYASRFIFMTGGSGGEASAAEFIAKTSKVVLEKPFAARELHAAIRESLGR